MNLKIKIRDLRSPWHCVFLGTMKPDDYESPWKVHFLKNVEICKQRDKLQPWWKIGHMDEEIAIYLASSVTFQWYFWNSLESPCTFSSKKYEPCVLQESFVSIMRLCLGGKSSWQSSTGHHFLYTCQIKKGSIFSQLLLVIIVSTCNIVPCSLTFLWEY